MLNIYRGKRYRDRERELVCTSNGGGVIMVIGGETWTVGSMNLMSEWLSDEKKEKKIKAKRAWRREEGLCRERERERERKGFGSFGEGRVVVFQGNPRVFLGVRSSWRVVSLCPGRWSMTSEIMTRSQISWRVSLSGSRACTLFFFFGWNTIYDCIIHMLLVFYYYQNLLFFVILLFLFVFRYFFCFFMQMIFLVVQTPFLCI